MVLDLHFGDADWERLTGDYAAWSAHALDRPLVQIVGHEHDPATRHVSVPKFHSNYGLDLPAEEVIRQVSSELEATGYYGDAYPRWFPNFGPGIVAGFLGARVQTVPDTVWFEPARLVPVSDLELAYQAGNAWWRRVQDLTRAATRAWADQVQVGHTDLGGNLDIVASFRTTQGLLYELVDEPEAIARLASQVTDLWLRYHDELTMIVESGSRGTTCWAPIWTTGRGYMLQCDFSYMISPQMFERFVLPDLMRCCDRLDQGFYHLDGAGQIAHLDLLLGIDRLRGIQWVPVAGAPPPEEWCGLLKRIIDAGKLCQLYVTAEGALKIVKTLGGRGFMLTITDEMSEAEATLFLECIGRSDVSR